MLHRFILNFQFYAMKLKIKKKKMAHHSQVKQ